MLRKPLITTYFGLWYFTKNDNDMLSYSLTIMMCFLTKEWCGFLAYTVNLFIKAYHRITYKEDLKVTEKRCVLEMICFSLWFWLWCAFYNRLLKKHIILLSKCTSRLADKRIHIKLVSSVLSLIWNAFPLCGLFFVKHSPYLHVFIYIPLSRIRCFYWVKFQMYEYVRKITENMCVWYGFNVIYTLFASNTRTCTSLKWV